MTTITRPDWHEQLIDALERRGIVCVGGSLGSTYHVLPDATDGPRCRISDHAGNDTAVMVGPTLGCDIRLPAWGGWDDVEAVANDVVRRLRAALSETEDD